MKEEVLLNDGFVFPDASDADIKLASKGGRKEPLYLQIKQRLVATSEGKSFGIPLEFAFQRQSVLEQIKRGTSRQELEEDITLGSFLANVKNALKGDQDQDGLLKDISYSVKQAKDGKALIVKRLPSSRAKVSQ